ncbi:MFS transporter [Aneurinibacillus aneurinilyticus]|jgi:predicted MFS family arabinose efflux permease|uniref:MFS transporter n=2 Tax=Aneurinibacillus aneurinilyticus TaxID=1391 RepID=A0A848D4I3_ANEAE|nr:MFS transporter [Aneurinibacillus aneurinilyticus]ERI07563.1 transporter, major facilitator family protein [Aneurinibacillus aneurinilyticus ATCC 12856]MCI1695678.1 MFS transporter [Aneurinibacillus aneurinilyticus]MED0669739.1 MFS transporter [Aneurinibacillus aneurinilyticus]MED0707671.1 MFS transporter [Aneurinibacillus aneurinilyticus]MED0722795.1 MFS transporter [Aneurinibacillus aneurinilyticus]
MSSLFRNRFVQAILLAGLFLQIGIWVRNFSVLLYVVEMTNEDAFAVSMVSVAEFAPIFIFSFIGGTFADRWRPKRTMIWCDILSSASVFAVLLTLIFGSWKAVFFATLFSAILSQFSQPSGLKLFKMHVPAEQIQAGMSIYQTIFAVFMVLGPVLGTFVYQSFGIQVAIAITGFAFLMSAAALLILPPDRDTNEEKTTQSTLFQEMADGIRYVLSKKVLTLLGVCFFAAGLAIGLIQPLGVFLVTERLGLEKEYLQWLMMANGIGMMLGGGLAMAFAKSVAPQKMLAFGMFVDAIVMAVSGISTTPWITLTVQFFGGLVLPCIQIGINTMILQNTEEQYIGRVNGILSPLFTGAMVVTMSMAGLLKNSFSLVTMYEAAGFLFIFGLLFILPLYRLPAIVKESGT